MVFFVYFFDMVVCECLGGCGCCCGGGVFDE